MVTLDGERSARQTELENINSELNNIDKEVGMLFKEGKIQEANEAKEKTATLKEKANCENSAKV